MKIFSATFGAAFLLVLLLGESVPAQDIYNQEQITKLHVLAERGIPEAQFRLGFIHQSGRGVPQDYKEAAKWYLKAAEQGFPRAQTNLGLLYANGWGVVKDYSVATDWLLKGANQNEPLAQATLTTIYLYGMGTKQNNVEAYKWSILASKRIAEFKAMNIKETAPKETSDIVNMVDDNKSELERKMTPKEIAEGKRLAAEWKPEKTN